MAGLPDELPIEELSEEQLRYATQLEEELRLLQAMPQVASLTESSLFHRGLGNQQKGAIAHLLCCTRASGSGRKPIDQKFNDRIDELACCNHIQAVQLLRSKISDQHGSEACLESARAARAAMTCEQCMWAATTEVPAPRAQVADAFTLIKTQQACPRFTVHTLTSRPCFTSSLHALASRHCFTPSLAGNISYSPATGCTGEAGRTGRSV